MACVLFTIMLPDAKMSKRSWTMEFVTAHLLNSTTVPRTVPKTVPDECSLFGVNFLQFPLVSGWSSKHTTTVVGNSLFKLPWRWTDKLRMVRIPEAFLNLYKISLKILSLPREKSSDRQGSFAGERTAAAKSRSLRTDVWWNGFSDGAGGWI